MKAPATTVYIPVYIIPGYNGYNEHHQHLGSSRANPRDPAAGDSLVSEHRWVYVRDLVVELPECVIDDNEAAQAELAALDIKESKIRAEMMSNIAEINERRQLLLAISYTPEEQDIVDA